MLWLKLKDKWMNRKTHLWKTPKGTYVSHHVCTFYRGTIESILTSCITVWYGACNASCRKTLQRIVRNSWEDRWCVSPLPPGHLQHPSHPQSPQHCRWSHPPDTQLLQSAAMREETAESPGEDQQTEGQLHPSGCQEAELSPVPVPPLFYPTHHWTLTLRPPPPPPRSPHPQDPPPPPLPSPPHLQTVTHTSQFVQHWTDHYLIQHWLQTTSSDSLIKDCSLSSYHFKDKSSEKSWPNG